MNTSRKKAVSKAGTIVFQSLVSLGVAGYIFYRSIPGLDFSSGLELRALVFPGLGVLMLAISVWGLLQLPLALELERDGRLTEGQIIGMRSTTDADDDRKNVVVYRYLDGHEAQQRVSTSVYRTLAPGGPVQVRFLPRDPRHSRLDL